MTANRVEFGGSFTGDTELDLAGIEREFATF